MPQRASSQELSDAHGWPIYAGEGEQVGTAERVYLDDATQEPEWLALTAEGKQVVVPIEGVQVQGTEHAIRVPYSRAQVQNVPEVEEGQAWITKTMERRLYQHYGLQPSEERSESVLPEQQSSAGQPSAASQAQQQASTFAEQAQERAAAAAQQAKERVQQQASTLRQGAQARAQESARRGREQAEGGLHRAAEMVRERSGGRGGMAAKVGTRFAGGIDRTADYVQGRNTGQMLSDVRRYVYDHPLRVVFGTIAGGFVLGRVLAPAKTQEEPSSSVVVPEWQLHQEQQQQQEKQQEQQQEQRQKKRLTSLLRREAKATAQEAAQQGKERAAGKARDVTPRMRKRAVGLGMLAAGLVARRMLR
jgi:sporulation protein YlmC with PRC-barrel domain